MPLSDAFPGQTGSFVEGPPEKKNNLIKLISKISTVFGEHFINLIYFSVLDKQAIAY